MSEVEEWRDIPGYEGLYEVSESGRVRSVARIITHSNGRKQRVHPVEKITKPSMDKRYLCVTLYRDGKESGYYVHRLVLMAFVGNPPTDRHVANHKSGDPRNNHWTNLEWATQGENMLHACRVLKRRVGANHYACKVSDEDIAEMIAMRAAGKRLFEIADIFSVAKSTVSRLCNGTGRSGMPGYVLYPRKTSHTASDV